MNRQVNISILGAGSWGTTLGVILSRKENLSITLWSAFRKQVLQINSSGENKDFLPGVKIPAKIKVTSSLEEALAAEIIILAIPVEFLRPILENIAKLKLNLKDKIFLSVAKGIEIRSLRRPSEIIKEQLGIKRVAVLSGPTIAREVVKGVPTVAAVVSSDKKILPKLQDIFKGLNLRVYRGQDLAGTELAGALKNIIAIACGISDGLGFGTNTKATLISRGLKELIRFAKVFGAREKTFWGVSGVGDLATTCFSAYSRNRIFGERIGKGEKLDYIKSKMKMVAEGVTTVKAVYRLSKEYKIDMPITAQVYSVLYKHKQPLSAVRDLMSRPLKAE